jgi:hypothetical protein
MAQGPLQAAQVVAGKYAIERELGRGGMGAVYVVRHVGTGKQMALKCLLPELIGNAEFVARFLREAQVGGRVHHRNVIDVFDVGRDGDVLYLVMELLEGKPLTGVLQDESMTLEQALLIILRAMEGVAAVHAHGIIHRDLKPDNIFVTYGSDGRLDHPKVLDFGISKLGDGAQGSLTQSGMALGTPYYMSVEQLSGQRDLDQRVDVYAMGVILYEAIAGMLPYWAESVSALAIRLLTEQPVHLQQIRPDLPPGLAGVIMRAMSLQRERRHPTLQALIDELRPFVPQASQLRLPEGSGRPLRTPRSDAARHDDRETASLPVLLAPRPGGPVTPPGVGAGAAATPAARRRRSAPMLALAVAGGLLLAGVGGFLAWQRPSAGTAVTPPAPSPGEAPSSAAKSVPELPKLAPQPPAAPQQALDAGGLAAASPPAPVRDAGPDPALPSGERRKARPRPAAGAASAAPAAAAGAAAKPEAPTPREAPAQGRAGALGKEDFQ